MPEAAVLASLGCGNPTALATESRRDGARSGLRRRHRCPAFRSPGRPQRQSYGLDMTDEMLALASETSASPASRTSNSSRARSRTFRCPTIRSMSSSPIASSIFPPTKIGSCARPSRAQARRTFRGLRCGHPRRDRPACARTCCCGSAASPARWKMNEYRDKLAKAGFERIEIEPTRIYSVEDARAILSGQGIDVDAIAPASRRQNHERIHPRPKRPRPKLAALPGCC